MRSKTFIKRIKVLLFISGIIFSVGFILHSYQFIEVMAGSKKDFSVAGSEIKSGSENTNTVFLPLVENDYPWISPFGVESNRLLLPGSTLLSRTTELNPSWVRLNGRISWRELQPNEGDPIQWDLLEKFENELRALSSTGIRPIVIVDDYPHWAVIPDVRQDGQLTSCGALQKEKFDDFAEFVRSLVSRYKTFEFNVHDWELGNEPDLDPDFVPPDHLFGCWGDVDDYLYGGEYYGEMLINVSPEIKKEDPSARVWIGGLLLARPRSNPYVGNPGLFFKGILEAGAAPYFDMVPYHWYPSYFDGVVDYDIYGSTDWMDWGGGTVGKAFYLKELMNDYGVDKPVFLNETGLGCPNNPEKFPNCIPPDYPDDDFYNAQANYIVRTFVRGISADISGFIWYTINGSGWRYTGLLESDGTPRPSYIAYSHLATRLKNTNYLENVDYGEGLDAYAFSKGELIIHVIWSISDEMNTVVIPSSEFVAAYDRDGNTLVPNEDGSFPVGFDPIYILKR